MKELIWVLPGCITSSDSPSNITNFFEVYPTLKSLLIVKSDKLSFFNSSWVYIYLWKSRWFHQRSRFQWDFPRRICSLRPFVWVLNQRRNIIQSCNLPFSWISMAKLINPTFGFGCKIDLKIRFVSCEHIICPFSILKMCWPFIENSSWSIYPLSLLNVKISGSLKWVVIS